MFAVVHKCFLTFGLNAIPNEPLESEVQNLV